MNKVRMAYLVSHPIQYQAPLFRRLADEADIDLQVYFCSDISVREHYDPDFGRSIDWGVSLLDGYRHEFLPALGRTDVVSWIRPFNYGLIGRLRKERFDVLLVYGYARWSHLVVIIVAKWLGIKVFLRDDVTLLARKRSLIKRWFKRAFFLLLRSRVDAFLVVGTRNEEYLLGQGIPPKKLFLLPHAVDNDFFQIGAETAMSTREELRQQLNFESERPIILFVGKLVPRKCAHDLLEAYIRLSSDGNSEPDPYLLFVGDGVQREVLEQRAAEYPWNSIKFVNFVNQQELPRYFNLCDVFVLPSKAESWGLIVNEVMNAARPIVLSEHVGCSVDLLRPGENGYTFRTGDVQALASSLQKILANSEKREQMGQKSREIIQSWGYDQFLHGLREAVKATVL